MGSFELVWDGRLYLVRLFCLYLIKYQTTRQPDLRFRAVLNEEALGWSWRWCRSKVFGVSLAEVIYFILADT